MCGGDRETIADYWYEERGKSCRTGGLPVLVVKRAKERVRVKKKTGVVAGGEVIGCG